MLGKGGLGLGLFLISHFQQQNLLGFIPLSHSIQEWLCFCTTLPTQPCSWQSWDAVLHSRLFPGYFGSGGCTSTEENFQHLLNHALKKDESSPKSPFGMRSLEFQPEEWTLIWNLLPKEEERREQSVLCYPGAPIPHGIVIQFPVECSPCWEWGRNSATDGSPNNPWGNKP